MAIYPVDSTIDPIFEQQRPGSGSLENNTNVVVEVNNRNVVLVVVDVGKPLSMKLSAQ